MAEYIKSDRSTASCGGIRLTRQTWSNFSVRSNWREIAPCRGRLTLCHCLLHSLSNSNELLYSGSGSGGVEWEREREREREKESVWVCVCVCVRESVCERECVWERKSVCECVCVCVCVCVLSCVISGGGPDILLPTNSRRPVLVYLSKVLVHSLCSPYRHLTHGHSDSKSQSV